MFFEDKLQFWQYILETSLSDFKLDPRSEVDWNDPQYFSDPYLELEEGFVKLKLVLYRFQGSLFWTPAIDIFADKNYLDLYFRSSVPEGYQPVLESVWEQIQGWPSDLFVSVAQSRVPVKVKDIDTIYVERFQRVAQMIGAEFKYCTPLRYQLRFDQFHFDCRVGEPVKVVSLRFQIDDHIAHVYRLRANLHRRIADKLELYERCIGDF